MQGIYYTVDKNIFDHVEAHFQNCNWFLYVFHCCVHIHFTSEDKETPFSRYIHRQQKAFFVDTPLLNVFVNEMYWQILFCILHVNRQININKRNALNTQTQIYCHKV